MSTSPFSVPDSDFEDDDVQPHGVVYSCRWGYCRYTFDNVDELEEHVVYEHAAKAKAVKKKDIPLLRRIDEGVGASLSQEGYIFNNKYFDTQSSLHRQPVEVHSPSKGSDAGPSVDRRPSVERALAANLDGRQDITRDHTPLHSQRYPHSSSGVPRLDDPFSFNHGPSNLSDEHHGSPLGATDTPFRSFAALSSPDVHPSIPNPRSPSLTSMVANAVNGTPKSSAMPLDGRRTPILTPGSWQNSQATQHPHSQPAAPQFASPSQLSQRSNSSQREIESQLTQNLSIDASAELPQRTSSSLAGALSFPDTTSQRHGRDEPKAGGFLSGLTAFIGSGRGESGGRSQGHDQEVDSQARGADGGFHNGRLLRSAQGSNTAAESFAAPQAHSQTNGTESNMFEDLPSQSYHSPDYGTIQTQAPCPQPSWMDDSQ